MRHNPYDPACRGGETLEVVLRHRPFQLCITLDQPDPLDCDLQNINDRFAKRSTTFLLPRARDAIGVTCGTAGRHPPDTPETRQTKEFSVAGGIYRPRSWHWRHRSAGVSIEPAKANVTAMLRHIPFNQYRLSPGTQIGTRIGNTNCVLLTSTQAIAFPRRRQTRVISFAQFIPITEIIIIITTNSVQ